VLEYQELEACGTDYLGKHSAMGRPMRFPEAFVENTTKTFPVVILNAVDNAKN
jgi:hypothetical protein